MFNDNVLNTGLDRVFEGFLTPYSDAVQFVCVCVCVALPVVFVFACRLSL